MPELASRTERKKISVTTCALLVVILCAGVAVLQALIAAGIALIFDQPYRECFRAVSMLLAGPAILATLGIRLSSFRARGRLLFDSGPNPKRKLFRLFAIVSLLVGIGNLEIARRTAELAPVDARVGQDLADQLQVLLRTQQHLTEQSRTVGQSSQHITNFNVNTQNQAAIAKFSEIVRQDRAKLARIRDLLWQDLAEQTRISDRLRLDRAEQSRLNSRLLPDEEAVQRGIDQLQIGFGQLATQPWDVLKSEPCFQLFLSLLVEFSAFLMFLMSTSQIQVRENGLWQNATLLRWQKIDSYRWVDDSTVEIAWGKSPVITSLAVPSGCEKILADILAAHVGPAAE